MAWTATREVAMQLRERARLAHPHECCGILLGNGMQIRAAKAARNIAADPERLFEIDPQALINAHRAAREGGPQVLGYYHSHPHGAPQPSRVDQSRAARDGSVWAIVTGDAIGWWCDARDGFAAIEVAIAADSA